MKKTVIIIEEHDAKIYRKSLLSVRDRLISSFDKSDDDRRHWINTHGPVLDDLLEELGYKGSL